MAINWSRHPPKLSWLKQGDRLLPASDDWDKAVTFSPHGFDRFVHIWSGYVRAGDALVDAAERQSVDRHFLVYPILFNYRHGLELAIKWIIEQYGAYVEVHLDANDRNHDLWNLWKLCKQVLIEIGGERIGSEGLAAVEQIVKDFHDIDKSGVAFRYSRNKDGATIQLPKTPVDLLHIQQVMEGVDNFFTGADGVLWAALP